MKKVMINNSDKNDNKNVNKTGGQPKELNMENETAKEQKRKALIDQTNKIIVNDYVDYMKENEEWDREDVVRFLAGDDPLAVIPESFSQSYYADLGLLD